LIKVIHKQSELLYRDTLTKNSPTSYLVTQLMFNCVNYKTAVLNDNIVLIGFTLAHFRRNRGAFSIEWRRVLLGNVAVVGGIYNCICHWFGPPRHC